MTRATDQLQEVLDAASFFREIVRFADVTAYGYVYNHQNAVVGINAVETNAIRASIGTNEYDVEAEIMDIFQDSPFVSVQRIPSRYAPAPDPSGWPQELSEKDIAFLKQLDQVVDDPILVLVVTSKNPDMRIKDALKATLEMCL